MKYKWGNRVGKKSGNFFRIKWKTTTYSVGQYQLLVKVFWWPDIDIGETATQSSFLKYNLYNFCCTANYSTFWMVLGHPSLFYKTQLLHFNFLGMSIIFWSKHARLLFLHVLVDSSYSLTVPNYNSVCLFTVFRQSSLWMQPLWCRLQGFWSERIPSPNFTTPCNTQESSILHTSGPPESPCNKY